MFIINLKIIKQKMLSLLLIIPIIGSILLLLVTDNEKAKKIALAASLINLIISSCLKF